MKIITWLLVFLMVGGCVAFSAHQQFPTQRMFGKKIRSRNLLDESLFIGKALEVGFTSPTIHPFTNNKEFTHASQTDSYGFSLFEYKHSEESLKRRRNPQEILKEGDYKTVSQSGQAIIHGSHHIYSLYGKVISGVAMLDHDVNVWDVKCAENQLNIDFANGHSTAKRLIPGSRLVIGKLWQCYGQDTDYKYGAENVQAFLVLAREIEYGEDNMVRVKFHVKKIKPKDLFYDLKVDYYSVPLVRSMVDSNSLQISESTNKRYSTNYRLFNTGFNYDITQQKVKNPSIELYKYGNETSSFTISCLDCFATVNLEIKAEIELGWWSVNNARILIGGQTVANATLLFSYQASYSKTKEGTLYESPVPIKISLFYIVSLDITPSLEYKLNIGATGKIEYRRNFLVTYSKYVGYKYESATGFSSVSEGDDLVWSTKSPGIYMEGEATAELAIYPKFKFELTSWLPSAEVSIIPTIKGQLNAEGTITRSSASLFAKFVASYKLELDIDVKDTFSESYEIISYTPIQSLSGTFSLQTTFFSATTSNSTVSANNPIPVNYINDTQVITGSTANTIEFSSTPKNSILISKKTIFKHLRNVLNTFSFISFSVKYSKPQLKTPLTGFTEFYDSSNMKYIYSGFLNNTDFTLDPVSSFTIQFEQIFAYQPIQSSETLTYPRQAIRDTSTMVTFIQKVNGKVPKFGVVMDSYGCFDAYVYEAWLENGRFVQTDGRKYEETYPYWSILGTYFYPINMQNNYQSDHYVVIQLIPNDPDFPLELNSIRFDPYFEFSPSDASLSQANLNRLIGLKFGNKDVVNPYLFVRPVNNEFNVKLYTDYEIYRAFYSKPKAGVGLTYTLTQTGSYIPMLKDNQYGTEVGIATTKPVTISVYPNYKLVNGIPSNAKNLNSQEETYFAFDCRTFYDSVALNTNSKVYLRVIDATTGSLIVNNIELDIRMVSSDGYVYTTVSKSLDSNMFVFDSDSVSNIKANCASFDRFVQIRLKNLASTTKTFQLELSLVHVLKSNDPISISMNPSSFGYAFKDISEILTREKNAGKSGIVLKQQVASFAIGKAYLSSNIRNIPPSFSDPSSIMISSSRIPDFIGSKNVIERLPISFKTNYGNCLFAYTHLPTSQSLSFSVEDLPNTDISLSFEKGLTKLERLSNTNTTIVNVNINGMDHYWKESIQRNLQQNGQEAFLYLKAYDQNNLVINLQSYFSRINSLSSDSQLTFELVPIPGSILPSKFKFTFEPSSSLFTTEYDIPVLNTLRVESEDNNNGNMPSVKCPDNCIVCDSTNSTCFGCQPGYFGRNCSETCLSTCKTCINGTSCATCPVGKSGFLCDIQDNQETPCSQFHETPIVSTSGLSGGSVLTYIIKIPNILLSKTNQTVISHSNVDTCTNNQNSFESNHLFECYSEYSFTTSISSLMNDSRIVKQLDSSGTVLTLNVPIFIGLITNKFDSQNGEDYCEIVNYGVNHQIKLVLSSHQIIGMNVNGNSTIDDSIQISYRKEIISVQDGIFSLSGKLFTDNVTVLSVSYLSSQPIQNIAFDIILNEYRPNAYNLVISSKQKVSYISGVFTFAVQVRNGDGIVKTVVLSISLSYTMPIDPLPTELKYSTQVNLYSTNFGQSKNLFKVSDSPHVLVNIVDSNGKSSSLPSSLSLSIKNAYLCCTKSGLSMPPFDPDQNEYGCKVQNTTSMSKWFQLIDNQVVASQYGTELIRFPLINFQMGFKFIIQSNMFPITLSESVQVDTCFIHTESILKSTSSKRGDYSDETSIHNAFDIIQVFSTPQQKPPIEPSNSSPIVAQSLRLNHSNKIMNCLSNLLIVLVLVMSIIF